MDRWLTSAAARDGSWHLLAPRWGTDTGAGVADAHTVSHQLAASLPVTQGWLQAGEHGPAFLVSTTIGLEPMRQKSTRLRTGPWSAGDIRAFGAGLRLHGMFMISGQGGRQGQGR